MGTRRAGSVAVRQQTSSDLPSDGDNPLFGVAMLKIALELKRNSATPLESIIRNVVERMRLDEPDFRRFLRAQGGLLRRVAGATSPRASVPGQQTPRP